MSNLTLRVLSALVLIPVMLAATWFGMPWFELVVLAIALLMIIEWRRLTAAGRQPVWLFAGVLYAAAFAFGMEALRLDPERGVWLVLFLFACVWGTDSAAYFVGRAVGGPRLSPGISPNKTWSGFVGGIGGGILAAAALAAILDAGIMMAAIAGAMVSVLGQMGDLLESAIKRHFGAKDSGHVIPGHGGVLDRVDSLAAAAPGLAALSLLTGGRMPLGG